MLIIGGTRLTIRPATFVSGFRYVDRFERRDGAWRVAERWAVREWTRSIPADTVRPKEGVGPDARRDRDDPVYRA
jgi:hypothetical protein